MNFNDNFDLKKAKSFLLTENFQIDEMDNLEEMAQITGALKDAIEGVIEANPDLNGLVLKKAIRSNADVIDALAGDDLYDNQLNRFISLSKGERENQPRGRKAGVPNAAKGEESSEEEYEDPNQLKMDFDTKPETIKIKPTTAASKPMAPAAPAAPAKERDLAQEIKDVEAELKIAGLKAIKSGDAKDMAKAKELTAKLKTLRAEVK